MGNALFAGNESVILQRVFRGLGGSAFGSARFEGWEGVFLAAPFLRAGRGVFGVGSALFARWEIFFCSALFAGKEGSGSSLFA